MKNIRKNQLGDTIVEVMIAISVVGMVLGASYATSNRALQTGRFAQEHTEALKLAESQIEKIKYIASVPSTLALQNIFSTTENTFCITDSFVKVSSVKPGYAGSCTGISGLYTALVTYTPDSGNDLFSVKITWDRIGSSLKGTVEIAYRLHK